MTFSDKEVAAFVNANFVSAWHNRGPGFRNLDFSTEQWIFASSMEAYATKNICTFFLSPEGKVFYYVAGYYSPDLFLRFLKAAVSLRQAVFDESMRVREGGLAAGRPVYEAESDRYASQRSKMGKGGLLGGDWRPALAGFRLYRYRGLAHKHSEGCLHNLRAGYDYLVELHDRWSVEPKLPDLEEIRYRYLWGNPFTEEAAGSTAIGKGEEPAAPDPGGPLRVRRAEPEEGTGLGGTASSGLGVRIPLGGRR